MKKTKSNKSLDELLKKTLTVKDYNDLKQKMGLSQNRLTRILKAPALARFDEIKRLAEIIKISAVKLVNEYEFGKKIITVDEMQQLTMF